MAIASITIGDWSGDGHDKTEQFLIEVPDRFTEAVLMENYEKTKSELGFGLSDFAEEYEDSLLPTPLLQALEAAGFDSDVFEGSMDEDGLYLFAEDMFRIAIFMASKGLEGFEYRRVKPDFSLFGRDNIGYGLFY